MSVSNIFNVFIRRLDVPGTSLGQKIEAVESWGIVPVRRSLGRRWTNYTLKKRRVLR